MMNVIRKLFVCLFLLMVIFSVYGCEEGPMERAGKAVDEAVEDTGEALEDAGEAVEEAMEDKKKE